MNAPPYVRVSFVDGSPSNNSHKRTFSRRRNKSDHLCNSVRVCDTITIAIGTWLAVLPLRFIHDGDHFTPIYRLVRSALSDGIIGHPRRFQADSLHSDSGSAACSSSFSTLNK